jgi:uncharacterized peroxidase-related enzyme
MPRLTPIDPATATGEAKELLDGIQAAFGMTPNSFRGMANNPAVLKGCLDLSGALEKTLPRKLAEQIAIAIAEQNGCAYCLSAHTAVAGLLGIDADEIDQNRSGDSGDERIAAALDFARTVNAKRGGVSDDDLAEVRAAGYDDVDIAAIVGHVALNVFTNYFNRVAQTSDRLPRGDAAAGESRLSRDDGGPASHRCRPATRPSLAVAPRGAITVTRLERIVRRLKPSAERLAAAAALHAPGLLLHLGATRPPPVPEVPECPAR